MNKQINYQRLPDNQINTVVEPPLGYYVVWWWKGNKIRDYWIKYQVF